MGYNDSTSSLSVIFVMVPYSLFMRSHYDSETISYEEIHHFSELGELLQVIYHHIVLYVENMQMDMSICILHWWLTRMRPISKQSMNSLEKIEL